MSTRRGSPGARRRAAGVRVSVYALGGSLVGVLGFGILWNGVATLAWGRAVFGLGLAVFGLDRAAAALAASTLARHADRGRPSKPR